MTTSDKPRFIPAHSDLSAALARVAELEGIASAHAAITQALERALGSNTPHGPYWEDGVEHLVAKVAAAEQAQRQAEAERDAARVSLRRVEKTLLVPAAEYVPAIGDALRIIEVTLLGIEAQP